ncbi:hypothetical protein M378DRAFT_164675 [Amanita muscaria Koide BX008]|uniref:Thioredoxin domain-containing protein n=1 Tax=Amanita muscaria (strain Koide BX008) TaxID=946122 RepID=A0A0C2WP05_AMAMK|nr:hypothetical protein M378DRAFT_164675 [Amanita muscaria Koide BX008]
MRIPNLLISLISLSPILTRAVAAAVSDRSANELFQLTPDTFKSSIASGHWVIEHFSPSCPHCRQFAPTWEKLVGEAKTEFPDVRLAQVNCALYGDLCNENGVTGYPTITLYHSGHVVKEFDGNRELSNLKSFLHEHISPPSSSSPIEADLEHSEEKIDGAETESNFESPHSHPMAALNPHGKVLSLTSSTFQTTLSQGPMFIKFFAPWCGHCRRLAPTWSKLAKATQNGRVTIAEVNCEEERALCRQYKVDGYPTLMFLRKEGKDETKTDYKSGRKLEQLVSFVEKASAPPLQPLGSVDELSVKITENKVVYILLLRKRPSQALLDAFSESASSLLGQPSIFYSTSHSLFEEYAIPSASSWALVALKDHNIHSASSVFLSTTLKDDPSFKATLSSIRDPNSQVSVWLRTHRLPTTVELTQDSFQMVMNAPEEPLVVIAGVNGRLKARVEERMGDLAAKWRVRTGGSGRAKFSFGGRGIWGLRGDGERVKKEMDEREVVFTWMDAEKWKDWLSSMYGMKVVDEMLVDLDDVPVVIVDHKGLIYWDQDSQGERLRLSKSLFDVVQDVAEGKLAHKNSENMIERLARFLNGGLIFSTGFVAKHPIKFTFYIVLLLFVVIWLVQRYVGAVAQNEYRRVSQRLD